MSKVFQYSYINNKIGKTAEAKVSVMCKALQYGLGCFTGIRGNWNKQNKNLYLFRLDDHYKRVKESAKILGMKLNYSYPRFQKILIDLAKKNNIKEDIYIRPTLYSASTALTPRFDNQKDDLAVYMISLKEYFNTENGLNVCVSSWRRFDDDQFSVKAKITGAYANSALAKTEAVQNGYDEAVFLNRDGKVCEASGANIFGIKDNIVYTPPLGANILNGITRKTLIELFENELGLEVHEELIDRSMLYTFDELFFSGTAAKVAWIRSVDKRKIGTGKIGKNTIKIKNIFERASTGSLDGYNKWLTPVY
ncbi:branched-chain amino acid transaminase [Candidatus Peregrinibacteria bacterium]|nr:branched-chain amino acid transaminase [Candidatus Peregrinibacteria bacterium]